MTANPFHFNKPTEPADFLGRTALVEYIANDLHQYNGDSYGIIGGRRFGKSSLLIALRQHLVGQLVHAEVGDLRVLPVLVSLKAIEPKSEQDVFGYIVRRVQETVATRPRRLRFTSALPIDLGMPAAPSGAVHPATLQDFEAVLENVAVAAQDRFGDLRLVLLVDEMDSVLDF
jgi:hypothetical protein